MAPFRKRKSKKKKEFLRLGNKSFRAFQQKMKTQIKQFKLIPGKKCQKNKSAISLTQQLDQLQEK